MAGHDVGGAHIWGGSESGLQVVQVACWGIGASNSPYAPVPPIRSVHVCSSLYVILHGNGRQLGGANECIFMFLLSKSAEGFAL